MSSQFLKNYMEILFVSVYDMNIKKKQLETNGNILTQEYAP